MAGSQTPPSAPRSWEEPPATRGEQDSHARRDQTTHYRQRSDPRDPPLGVEGRPWGQVRAYGGTCLPRNEYEWAPDLVRRIRKAVGPPPGARVAGRGRSSSSLTSSALAW